MKTSEKSICIMSPGLSPPGLARSAHHGQTKLLRGYVSKSSAALNQLKIMQLACERPRGRSQTVLRGPAHQFAVRMRIIISNNIINYGTRYLYYDNRQFFSTTALHLLRRGFCTLVLLIIICFFIIKCTN